MNKEELRKEYKNMGWRVPNVNKWVLDREEDIDGKTHKFYNLNVQSPKKGVGIVQVSVVNEDQMNEEGRNIENAKPFQWEREIIPFEEALRDYLDEIEEQTVDIYAISVLDIKELDEVASVMVYTNSTNTVTEVKNIVKRRDNIFEIKPIK